MGPLAGRVALVTGVSTSDAPTHADLVEFLVSDRGAWIRGQVVNTEGGFDRHA